MDNTIMDREYTRAIDTIKEESLHEHLNRQLDTYTNTQVRAERIIQLLVASAAVIATLGDPEVFSRIGGLYVEVISVDLILEQFVILTPEEQSRVLEALGVPLSSLLFTIGALFLADSIVWSVDIIRMPRLRPYLSNQPVSFLKLSRSEIEYILDLEYSPVAEERERLRNDIRYNMIILGRMDIYLKRSYILLALGIMLLVSSTIPYSAELAENISILTALLTAICASTSISIVMGLINILRSDFKGMNMRSVTIPVPEQIHDLYNNSAGVNMVHSIIYLLIALLFITVYFFSIIVTRIWMIEMGWI